MTKHHLICKCRRCQVEYDIPLSEEAYQLALRALKEHVPAKVDTYIHDCKHDHNYGISEVIGIGFKEIETFYGKRGVIFTKTRDEYIECLSKIGDIGNFPFVNRVEAYLAAQDISIILYGKWEKREDAKTFIMHTAIREENSFWIMGKLSNKLEQISNKYLLEDWKDK